VVWCYIKFYLNLGSTASQRGESYHPVMREITNSQLSIEQSARRLATKVLLSEKLLPNSSNFISNFHFRSRYSSPLPQADIGTSRQSQATKKQPICTTVYPYRMQGIRGGLSGLYSLRAFPWLSEGQAIQRSFSTTGTFYP
jgi:hypothetical protein